MPEKIRLQNLDIVKGIAIIGVVFGHLELNDTWLKTIVYAFHLPVFFIVSGIVLSLKYSNNTNSIDLVKHFWRRIKQLLVPYFIFCIIKIIFFCSLSFVSVGAINIELLKNRLFRTFTFQGFDALWFLPIFFISEFLFLLTVKYLKNTYILLVSLTLAVCSFFFNSTDIFVFAERIAIGFIFIALGYFLYAPMQKSISKLKNFAPSAKNSSLVLTFNVVALLTGCFLSILNHRVDISEVSLNCVPLFYINAVLIVFALINLFSIQQHHIKHINNFFEFFGIASMTVLCTHNIFIEIIRLVDYKLFDDFLIYNSTGAYIATVIVLLLEWPTILFLNRHFPWAIGKTR